MTRFQTEDGTVFLCHTLNARASDTDLLKSLGRFKPLYPDARRNRFFADCSSTLPEKQLEWAESRRCLVSILSCLEATQLERAALSLAHTKSASVAAAYVPDVNAPAREIGVDIEALSREVSEGAGKKIIRDSERALGFSALEAWLLKEAAYKADIHALDSVISDYEIRQEKVHRDKNPKQDFEFKLLKWENHRIAWALAQFP